MTGRTHDLVAFTSLTYLVATQPLVKMSVPTLIIALVSAFIGALAPDLDQPTADLWRRVPIGSFWGKLLSPLFGGHRYISHSILGIFLFAFGTRYLFTAASKIILVDMNIVWFAFMIGFISHLIADSFTRDGVPWLFPIAVKFGFPPIKFLRFRTGGTIEKAIIFPVLLAANIYLVYAYHEKFIDFFKNYIT